MHNQGLSPVLVQSWIDDGRQDADPDQIAVPFVVSPPIARADAGKGQALRIAYTHEPLPQDRESVFWLNILEIPAKASGGTDGNRLQFAFRNRLKLFFRPEGLPDNANAAPARLVWSIVRDAAGEGYALKADNPTPYYVSLLSVTIDEGHSPRQIDAPMLAPFDSATLPLPGLKHVPDATIRVQSINDYGAVIGTHASATLN